MMLTEDEIVLMAGSFKRVFLDPAFPEDTPPPGRHRPGPLREGEPPLGRRHQADPLARVLVGVMFSQAFLLPMLSADNPDERDGLNTAILRIVGVTPLLRAGMIKSATVCWSQGRWPRHPAEIRVALPGGEAQRRRLLGGFEVHVRMMVTALTAADRDQPRRRPAPG